MDDKWKQFGSMLTDAIMIYQIYIAVLCILAVITAVVVISYVKTEKGRHHR